MANANQTKKNQTPAPVPVKNTMNFVRHQRNINFTKLVPVLVIVGVIALVFLKFGIIDPLGDKTDVLEDIASKKENLASLEGKMAEYDKLAMDYGRYSYGWMSDSEVSTVDRLKVLDLVEKKVATIATVENLSINNNVLSLNVRGITLTQASEIVADLETSELVKKVSVGSASADSGREASIFMTVVMTKGEE